MADKSVGVTGFVSTKKHITGSYLLPDIHSWDDRLTPIEEARIYIAFDQEGKEVIEGFESKSGADGMYRIETKGIPPAKKADGDYYLVVEKEGYERIVKKLGILGSLNQYIRNTAVLKPISEPAREPYP